METTRPESIQVCRSQPPGPIANYQGRDPQSAKKRKKGNNQDFSLIFRHCLFRP